MKSYEKSYFADHFGDYRSGKALEDTSTTLYKDQLDLPRLPIPKLEETLELYLKSLEPLVTKEELNNTTSLTDKFKNGIGKELQKRLIERREELSETSWLQEPWNKLGYLEYRESVMHNVSFYFLFANEKSYAMNPARRAARFLSYLIDIRNEVVTGSLEPDKIKTKDGLSAMCSTQWKYVFNSSRMPGEKADFYRTFSPKLFNHFVVLCQNRLFKVEAYDWGSQTTLSVDEIEAILRSIVKYAKEKGEKRYWIGSMSSDHRDIWYDGYNKIVEVEENKKKLEIIQSSMFLLAFDDVIPSSTQEAARHVLHSYQNKNRYWDKLIQLNLYNDGKMGFVAEHSMADGTIANRIMNTVFNRMMKDPEDFKKPKFDKNLEISKYWNEVEFEITGKLQDAIEVSNLNYYNFTEVKEHIVLNFRAFGIDEIKRMKVSPDGFVQVALQLAYYRSFGKCCATYESTQTRRFLHGRTEAGRSCSSEALAFSKSMLDNTVSNGEREKLLKAAIIAHVKYVKRASQGRGCDRHLLGLKLMLKSGEDSSLYDDPAYSKSSHWAISTSRLDGDGLLSAGFGEVVPDGLGLGYSFKRDYLSIAVSSANKEKKSAEIFTANLEQSLLEMKELLMKSKL